MILFYSSSFYEPCPELSHNVNTEFLLEVQEVRKQDSTRDHDQLNWHRKAALFGQLGLQRKQKQGGVQKAHELKDRGGQYGMESSSIRISRMWSVRKLVDGPHK